MLRTKTRLSRAAWTIVFSLAMIHADSQTVIVPTPAPPHISGFKMGESRRPDGVTLTLDSNSLRLDGKPWTPVMAEFHYARYPESEWREELLKMKAGGVDIVSTYVFWIYHEEIEGRWDWSGRRNLRHFVELCQEVGLKVMVRCGPWDHGEVRNGGFPDWLVQTGWQLRSDDTNYLAAVKLLYEQINGQLSGLLWRDGGPVIGIQLENEYEGPAEHLLALKRLARAAGLDVPFYTRTGWPALRSPMPFGEILPLYSVYAVGFWDRQLTPMPENYWTGYQFSRWRADDNIIADLSGQPGIQDPPGLDQYPYLTCEIGGGMMSSYHRRIFINPLDVESTALVKLGDGSVSLGYYMYHGGINPDGKLTTLQESQATGYWNDMPVKNYDFQAPLGAYGQIRPQYHWLRRLHLFLHEWGADLAGMPATLPKQRPRGKNDLSTLRWDVRSDGQAGFVFVNNYQRLQPMPPETNVQFTIQLPSGMLTFPEQPVTVPSDACFFWPFNLDLGRGVRLAWATAQPVTAVDDGSNRTVFFAEIPGMPAGFAFNRNSGLKNFSGKISRGHGRLLIGHVKPGPRPALQVSGTNGSTVSLVLLSDRDSLALWKGDWQGCDRVFLTHAGLVLDGTQLRLTSEDRADLNIGVYPSPVAVTFHDEVLRRKDHGIFGEFTPDAPRPEVYRATLKQIQPAGPLRKIIPGKIAQPVAAAPDEADFNAAAVWKVRLPSGIDPETDPILRLHYLGDVARVTLNGKLLTDDFYNGKPFDIGLRRYAPGILTGDLEVAILPLQKNAPIYLANEAQPEFGNKPGVALLNDVEIVPRYQVQLNAR